MADLVKYERKWIVVIHDRQYVLTETQANQLKALIASGNRGMAIFDDFVLNIPMIQEFYTEEKPLNEHQQRIAALLEERRN